MVTPEFTGHERYVPGNGEAYALEPNTVYLALHVSQEEQVRYCREPGYRRYYRVPVDYLENPSGSRRDLEKPVRRALNNPEVRGMLLSQSARLNGVWSEDEPYPDEIVVPHIELDGSPTIIDDKLLIHHHSPEFFTQLYGRRVSPVAERAAGPNIKGSRLGKLLGWSKPDSSNEDNQN